MYFVSRVAEQQAARSARSSQEMAKLNRALKSQEISLDEFVRRQKDLNEAQQTASQQTRRENLAHGNRWLDS